MKGGTAFGAGVSRDPCVGAPYARRSVWEQVIPIEQVNNPMVPRGQEGRFEAPARPHFRARLLRFAELSGVFAIFLLVSRWIVVHGLAGSLPGAPLWTGIATDAGVVLAFWIFYVAARKVEPLRTSRAVTASLVLVGAVGTFGVIRRGLGFDPQGYSLLATVLVAHSVGAALLPWPPVKANLPIAWTVVVNILSLLVFERREPAMGDLGYTVAVAGIGAPGLVISMLKAWRARDQVTIRFFQDRLREVRQELVDARVIHEGAFPVPRERGAVRFTYGYEPMRQIGGDYLHAHLHPLPEPGDDGEATEEARPISVVSLDVTGHGIPAALTVNRIHGELSRIFAEQPDVMPGEVIRLLNRYVYLTLSGYGVFVAAFVLRIDPRENLLRYASAGFPPAILRSAGGAIVELPTTATVLGVLTPPEFEPGQQSRPFHPGDTLLAFTDGAMEAKNRSGAEFGLRRIRELVAEAPPDQPGRLPEVVLRAVDRFRHGAPSDDTLVFEVFRPFIGAVSEPEGRAQKRSAGRGPAGAPGGSGGRGAEASSPAHPRDKASR